MLGTCEKVKKKKTQVLGRFTNLGLESKSILASSRARKLNRNISAISISNCLCTRVYQRVSAVRKLAESKDKRTKQ